MDSNVNVNDSAVDGDFPLPSLRPGSPYSTRWQDYLRRSRGRDAHRAVVTRMAEKWAAGQPYRELTRRERRMFAAMRQPQPEGPPVVLDLFFA